MGVPSHFYVDSKFTVEHRSCECCRGVCGGGGGGESSLCTVDVCELDNVPLFYNLFIPFLFCRMHGFLLCVGFFVYYYYYYYYYYLNHVDATAYLRILGRHASASFIPKIVSANN